MVMTFDSSKGRDYDCVTSRMLSSLLHTCCGVLQRRGQQRQMNAACARVRNAISKREIKKDFRLG